MNRPSLLALMLIPAIALAADAPAPDKPKSPAALSAVSRAQKAQAEAEAAYRESVLTSKRVEVGELRAAQEAAMKAGPGSLDEANRIDAVVKQVQAEIDAIEKGQKPGKPAATSDVLATARAIGVTASRTADGVELRGDGLLESTSEYRTPLRIDFVAKTSGKDMRIYFGRGSFILNWGNNPNDLRCIDPATNSVTTTGKSGLIPRNQWVHLTWIIQDQKMELLVDGEPRFAGGGSYQGFAGRVGIGGGTGSVITVKSVTVGPG